MTIALTLIAFRPKEIFTSLCGKSTSFLNAASVDFLGSSFILTGAFGTFMGQIIQLANLNDPKALIPGLTVNMFPLIYGFIGKFIIDSFLIENTERIISNEERIKKSKSKGLGILGIILLAVVFILTLLIKGGSPLLFYYFSSIMIVFGGGIASFFITFNVKDVKNALKGGFGGEYANVEEAKSAVSVSAAIYNRFISFGLIGQIIGLTMMFINLNDLKGLGPRMALALISYFYALFLGFISYALGTAARRQVNLFGEDKKMNLMMSPTAAGLFALGLSLASFAVLLASF
jgi:flagellar motor component MotA